MKYAYKSTISCQVGTNYQQDPTATSGKPTGWGGAPKKFDEKVFTQYFQKMKEKLFSSYHEKNTKHMSKGNHVYNHPWQTNDNKDKWL